MDSHGWSRRLAQFASSRRQKFLWACDNVIVVPTEVLATISDGFCDPHPSRWIPCQGVPVAIWATVEKGENMTSIDISTMESDSESGAATAEYAIATMAAVGFAGLLVVIMRSDEVRKILTDLVRSALTLTG